MFHVVLLGTFGYFRVFSPPQKTQKYYTYICVNRKSLCQRVYTCSTFVYLCGTFVYIYVVLSCISISYFRVYQCSNFVYIYVVLSCISMWYFRVYPCGTFVYLYVSVIDNVLYNTLPYIYIPNAR